MRWHKSTQGHWGDNLWERMFAWTPVEVEDTGETVWLE
jgi:hypothetical protein